MTSPAMVIWEEFLDHLRVGCATLNSITEF